jgi:cell division protein ZapA
MSHVKVTINGRQYRMACEEGQETRLLKLAESLETRIGSLRGKFGEIGDARLTVMAALTVCDELLDAGQRIRALEEELATLRDVRVASADRAKATQVAVANALNAAADRIEKTTQVLNRTIGGGVAIG